MHSHYWQNSPSGRKQTGLKKITSVLVKFFQLWMTNIPSLVCYGSSWLVKHMTFKHLTKYLFRRKVINRKDLKELTAKTLARQSKDCPCSPCSATWKRKQQALSASSAATASAAPEMFTKSLRGRQAGAVSARAQQPEGRQGSFFHPEVSMPSKPSIPLCDYKQTGFPVRWRSRVYLICHWAASLLTSFSFLFLFYLSPTLFSFSIMKTYILMSNSNIQSHYFFLFLFHCNYWPYRGFWFLKILL